MNVMSATKCVGATLLAAALLGGGCAAWAQVAAHQGTEIDEQAGAPGEYKSPLVLEAPVADLFNPTALKRTRGWLDLSFRKFVCNRASLLLLELKPGKPEQGTIIVRAKAGIWVAAGQDRLVGLRIALLRGEQVVGQGVMGPENADEGKVTSWTTTLAVGESALKGDGDLKLRIVMSVKPN